MRIRELAATVGYSACGIARAEVFHEYAAALDDCARRFPDAAAVYARMRRRVDPRQNRPWARSIVVCLRRYGKYALPPGLAGVIGRNYLVDQRLRQCPEHDMPARFTEGLKALGLRVARGGLPDRLVAAKAGVARVARNCFAYSEHGSWINIATWVVDADLPPDVPTLDSPCPEGCDACARACPTGAIVAPRVMRLERCVAYLTYHAPEPIAAELWERMGTWVYGCDVCQEVCPLNRGKWDETEPAAWLTPVAERLTPAALAVMDPATYRDVVHPLFWYIAADNLARWHANARRAAAVLAGLTGLTGPAGRGGEQGRSV